MAVELIAPAQEQTRARYPDESGYVERDGVRVFYEVYGSGEPTILLLPTWALIHSRHWKMQIPYLARHGRVVTFDGRGNGRSDRPQGAEAYAIREFVADTLAVMDATATERAVLLGVSCAALWGSCSQRSIRSASPAPPSSGRRSRWRRRCPSAPSIPSTSGSIPTKVGRSTTCTTGCRTIGTSSSSSSGSASRSRTRRSRSRTPSAGRSRRPPKCSRTTTPASTCRSAATSGALRARSLSGSRHARRRGRTPLARAGRALAEATGGQLVTLRGTGHFPQARDPVVINLLVQDFVRAAAVIVVAETREQTRARYPDESGYVERDGVRVFYEVYGIAASRRSCSARRGRSSTRGSGRRRSRSSRATPRRHVRRPRQRPLRPPGRRPRPTTSASSRWTRSRPRRDRDRPRRHRRVLGGHAAGPDPRHRAAGARRRRGLHRPRVPRRRAAPERVCRWRTSSTPTRAGRSTTGTTGCGTTAASSSSSSGSSFGAALDEADRGLRRLGTRDDGRDAHRRAPRREPGPRRHRRARAARALSGAGAPRRDDAIASHTRGRALAEHTGGDLVLLAGLRARAARAGSRLLQPAAARLRAEARVIVVRAHSASRPAPATPTRRATSSATACASSTRSTATRRRRFCSSRPRRSRTHGSGRGKSRTCRATSAWSCSTRAGTASRTGRTTPRRIRTGR